MSLPTCLLALVLLLTAALPAQPALDNARRAQALLGADTWSQLLRIDNADRDGPYPRTVYALVFEFQGILWFYTDADGTQSFSLHQDNLVAEKADFAPLLREIDAGFRRWSVILHAELKPLPGDAPLRNGCFIESVAALRQRWATGVPTEDPRLLSYYAETTGGRKGHTVLAYGAGETLEVYDPARPDQPLALAATRAADPLWIARALEGREIASARFFPIRPGVHYVVAESSRRPPEPAAERS